MLKQVNEFTKNDVLFEAISTDISRQGYSINSAALPLGLTQRLIQHLTQQLGTHGANFVQAATGRSQSVQLNKAVRGDEIRWITAGSNVEREWLAWAAQLQDFLNRRLFLGLFSFESHFAHYAKGDFYQRHVDAFKGDANRVLSIVVYLNPEWHQCDGGELVLYMDERDQTGIKVKPSLGAVVVFLSEDFPHEVLSATHDRYSIAGWFRCNSSRSERVDPPL